MIEKIAIALHKLQVFRRAIIVAIIGLGFFGYIHTFKWLSTLEQVDIGTAGVVAALLAPITALMGSLINIYAKNPYKDGLE